MLANLYTTVFERPSIRNPYLLSIAAAAHDIAREDEGVDHWDKESGQFVYAYLRARGYSHEEASLYAQAIIDKDPQEDLFTTEEQRIVHDADCLEIHRCLRETAEFKPERLCFTRFGTPQIPFDQAKLLDEVARFVKLTEEPQLKLEIERHSDDCFGDMLRLIDKHRENLPLIFSLLEKRILPVAQPPALRKAVKTEVPIL
jgi:hypothetical protein